MERMHKIVVGLVMSGMTASVALAGEASTQATATGGYLRSGTAAATANYNGGSGPSLVRTHTDTGSVNLARGLAVGLDEDGLDFSYSHAIAPNGGGPAYAGTFNMSIGANGQVAGSYGGTIAQGGLERTASAGGTTRGSPSGAQAQANATGNTVGGGHVVAQTNSYSSPRQVVRPATYGGRPVTVDRYAGRIVRPRTVPSRGYAMR